jgi:hypothetical protein
MLLRAVSFLCLSAILCIPLAAQTGASASTHQHAVLEHTPNGNVSITAQGPWSLEQAVAKLRREYGWVVDYEESIPAPNNLVQRPDGRSALRSRAISLSIPSPNSGSSEGEQAALQSLVGQLHTADYSGYKIHSTTPTRFDLTSSTVDGGLVPLDTLITLPKGTVPISTAINEILAAVRAKIGYPIVRGGLEEPELDRVSVTFEGSANVPARSLLSHALDAASVERVWILTYEPTMSSFVLGIEPAVRMTTTSSGKLSASVIPTTKGEQ